VPGQIYPGIRQRRYVRCPAARDETRYGAEQRAGARAYAGLRSLFGSKVVARHRLHRT
jgi:hypothetical protein